MDIQSVNALLRRYRAMPLTPEQQDLVEKIDRLVTEFEYEKAIALINAA
jgi:hypothetical protein